jgi:DNA polymerase phi
MRRQLLAEYIVSMIRAVKIEDIPLESNWIEDVALPTLASIAYCRSDAYAPSLSEKTRNRFRTSLMSVFAHVLSDFAGYSYSCNLLSKFIPDAVPMDAEVTQTKDEALSIMRNLLKKGNSDNFEQKAPCQALALLYSLVIIQLYNGEPDAVSVLEELKLCGDKLIKHSETNDSDIDASEVLVELLLSFISKPSAVLRKATQHVFSAFMQKVTTGGLNLMTDILGSSEGLRGQQELFDQEPEGRDEMNIEDEDNMDSDVEVIDMDGEEVHLNDHLNASSDEISASDSNDASESTSGDSDNDPEDEALNTALAQVLGTHNLKNGAGDVDSDSDADMTDSEMIALDSKLVEIFSQRKKAPNKKQEQKDAKETIVSFKSRVLDLLDIYVKKQAANPLAFSLLLPLLQLIRTTKAKPLADKAFSIIQAFFKSFKAAKKAESSSFPSSNITIASQLELLKAIHLEVSQDPSHMFAKAASTASLLVASSLLHVDKESVQEIATVYRDSQVRWARGEVRIQASFFVEWINWCQSLARP